MFVIDYQRFLVILDFLDLLCYNMQENKILLIKSGGGTGPMKPGNLFFQGAKSR
jgi:hypothetical protein